MTFTLPEETQPIDQAFDLQISSESESVSSASSTEEATFVIPEPVSEDTSVSMVMDLTESEVTKEPTDSPVVLTHLQLSCSHV